MYHCTWAQPGAPCFGSVGICQIYTSQWVERNTTKPHPWQAPVRLQLYGQKGPAVCLSHKRIFILLSNPSCSHELQDAWGLSHCHTEMCMRGKLRWAFLMPTLTPTTPSPGEHNCTRAAQGLGSAKNHPVYEYRRPIIAWKIHSINWVGKNHRRSSVQPPCPSRVTIEHMAQNCVHWYTFSEEDSTITLSNSGHPHSKALPHVQEELPAHHHFLPAAPCPIAWHHQKEPTFILSTHPLNTFLYVYVDEVKTVLEF